MVIQRFDLDFPLKFGLWVLVIYLEGHVSSIVISPELWSCDFSFLEGSWFGDRFLVVTFFLESARGFSSVSCVSIMFGKGSRESMFVDGFVVGVFEFFFGDVFSGEVSEGRVWVFGGVMVFPGFEALIVLLGDDAFELVFAWVFWELHWIWEARLSLRRDWASELCWSLGSIKISYN